MVSSTKKEKSTKKIYNSPTLTCYGTIKEMTGGASSGNMIDGMAMLRTMSDRRAKENIIRVGEHPAGFGLYLFDYKPAFASLGSGRQFGVMADEVERIVPDAVSIGGHGFRVVDYAKLGIVRH